MHCSALGTPTTYEETKKQAVDLNHRDAGDRMIPLTLKRILNKH